ncbi:MAG: hypothetical protein GF341_00680 [candidate division Zixibacteria bacterium]|nr:hypothetical protein [candidate division Zixibacteria bacterium]
MTMETTSEYQTIEEPIRGILGTPGTRVFTQPGLHALHRENREQLESIGLSKASEFISAAIETGVLRVVEVRSESYASKKRFAIPGATAFEIALSLGKGTYFTHASAVFLHGLNDQIPKTIYVNREQSPKPSPKEAPTQERINRAFAGRQRTSNYVFRYESNRIVLLSGKSTGRLGVVTIEGPSGETLDTTSIERTLVDMVVRPAYSGGIAQVLSAFRGAKGRVTGTKLLTALDALRYIYPYHQTIGFLLERAGYPDKQIKPFRRCRQEFDFYLVHGMRETEFIPEWRLHIPKGF